ncbi:hypothetical protein [Paenibacillus phyllosphaerae]|nr:hypothetical protein [Paenibacillus phyllosphaerae]
MSLVAWAIAASEVLFWVVILIGLIARYKFGRKKLGLFFLALTPVIDIFLLVTTSIDLHRGATATVAHALAGVYIGVSLAFGSSMIKWADERFRYYVTKQGDKPAKRYGMDHARHYFKGWIRHVIAFAIGAGMLYGLILYIDDPQRTEAIRGVLRLWSIIVGIDLLITVTYFIWPREPKKVGK